MVCGMLPTCRRDAAAGYCSTYPPHKHEIHHPPGEFDLDEIYFLRIDHPDGTHLCGFMHRGYSRMAQLLGLNFWMANPSWFFEGAEVLVYFLSDALDAFFAPFQVVRCAPGLKGVNADGLFLRNPQRRYIQSEITQIPTGYAMMV